MQLCASDVVGVVRFLEALQLEALQISIKAVASLAKAALGPTFVAIDKLIA